MLNNNETTNQLVGRCNDPKCNHEVSEAHTHELGDWKYEPTLEFELQKYPLVRLKKELQAIQAMYLEKGYQTGEEETEEQSSGLHK